MSNIEKANWLITGINFLFTIWNCTFLLHFRTHRKVGIEVLDSLQNVLNHLTRTVPKP